MKQLYTLLESPTFLQFPELYKSMGIEETRFRTARTFNKAIAKNAPDIVLAEFIYGFGNNYAGVNISNLDVSLYALQRHAPHARVVIVADKHEYPYVPKLEALFEIDAVLVLPVKEPTVRDCLNEVIS